MHKKAFRRARTIFIFKPNRNDTLHYPITHNQTKETTMAASSSARGLIFWSWSHCLIVVSFSNCWNVQISHHQPTAWCAVSHSQTPLLIVLWPTHSQLPLLIVLWHTHKHHCSLCCGPLIHKHHCSLCCSTLTHTTACIFPITKALFYLASTSSTTD
jgi:hypothetical protein